MVCVCVCCSFLPLASESVWFCGLLSHSSGSAWWEGTPVVVAFRGESNLARVQALPHGGLVARSTAEANGLYNRRKQSPFEVQKKRTLFRQTFFPASFAGPASRVPARPYPR